MALQLFKIADVTVATPQSSIDFNSIPSGYTDLKIVYSARSTRAGNNEELGLCVNGLSTSIYSARFLYASSNTPGSASESSANRAYLATINASGGTANTFNNAEIYFPNYTSSNNKSFMLDNVYELNSSTGTELWLDAYSIATTNAISSISIFCLNSSNFAANSTFTLYGVL